MNFSHFPPCVTLYNWVYCNWNTERTGADIDFQVFKLEGTKFSLFIYKSCQQAIPFFMPHMFVCKIGIPWIRFWVWRVFVFFFFWILSLALDACLLASSANFSSKKLLDELQGFGTGIMECLNKLVINLFDIPRWYVPVTWNVIIIRSSCLGHMA